MESLYHLFFALSVYIVYTSFTYKISISEHQANPILIRKVGQSQPLTLLLVQSISIHTKEMQTFVRTKDSNCFIYQNLLQVSW